MQIAVFSYRGEKFLAPQGDEPAVSGILRSIGFIPEPVRVVKLMKLKKTHWLMTPIYPLRIVKKKFNKLIRHSDLEEWVAITGRMKSCTR